MEFFNAEKISTSTTKIANLNNVYCYLVEGSQHAVLIDTGMGAGDLKAYVESLTDKPISVILTHGHVDHVGGAASFDRVYLHKNDWELVKMHTSMDIKKVYLSMALKHNLQTLREEDICLESKEEFLPLEEGQIFDLGGMVLEIVEVPGHTRGSVCVLNRQERWMLFGDSCSPSVFLWNEEATCVEEYLESLMHLKLYEKRYDSVFFSHGIFTADKSILDGVIQVCKEILEEKDDGILYPFLDFRGLRKAKAADHRWIRADGGLGNIVYKEGKLFITN